MFQLRQHEKLIDRVKPQWDLDKTNGEALYWLIYCYFFRDRKDEAIKLGIESIHNISNNTWKGRLYNRIGSFYWRTGELKNAEVCYNKSMELLSDFGTDSDNATISNNLGILFDVRGELGKALKLYKKALNINTKIGDEAQTGSNLVNIGIIYYTQLHTAKAEETLLQALAIFKKFGRFSGVVVVSHQLLLLYVKLGNKPLANEMFLQIESIARTRDDSLMQSVYLLSKAIILRMSGRLRDTVKAINILKDFIDNPNFEYEHRTSALIQLAGLKLDEYRLLNNYEILDEIKDLINRIHDFAKKNLSYPLVVDTKLLNVRLLVINNEFEKAHKMLKSTYEFLSYNELEHLTEKVKAEEVAFEKNIANIKSLIDMNKEEIAKMEISSIQDYLRTLQKQLD
ncbi:MAG: tetratricopeptide repeat protein [Candidatus Kariarchaeaceae archaeon]